MQSVVHLSWYGVVQRMQTAVLGQDIPVLLAAVRRGQPPAPQREVACPAWVAPAMPCQGVTEAAAAAAAAAAAVAAAAVAGSDAVGLRLLRSGVRHPGADYGKPVVEVQLAIHGTSVAAEAGR
jgi:hypothetical protein